MRHRSAYRNKCLYLAPLCLVMATAHGAVFGPLSQQATLRAEPARPNNSVGSFATNELPDEGAKIGNLLGGGLTLRLEPFNSTPAPEEVVIIDAFFDNNSASDIDLFGIKPVLSCDATPGPMAEGSVVAFSDPLPAQACTPDVANDPLPACISGTCVGPGETCTPGVDECKSGIPEDCIDDDGLPGGPGHCLGTGTCPTVSAPLLNEDRDDYVLACAAVTAVLIDSDCAADSTVLTRAFNLDPSPGGSCPLAIGESAYVGTFAFQPSATASGTFTVELHSSSLMLARVV